MNGVTIQVVHSDAEGRMVLADTLALASRDKPALLIDFATLTGACVNALTDRYSGAFTNRPGLEAPLQAAGRASGERVWCFPMDEDFDAELESTVADVLQCSVESKGDHILAARFLGRFVPADLAWAHIDLSASERKGGLAHVPTEFTGFGVRFATHAARRRHPPRPAGVDPGARHVTTLRLRRPDDWHLHLRDGAAARRGAAVHRGALRPRARDAEPQAADDDHRGARRLPRAHPRRAAGRH